MKRIFNCVNARLDLGEVVYYHYGEIKNFPQYRSQESYGRVIRRISPESVEVELFQKDTHE